MSGASDWARVVYRPMPHCIPSLICFRSTQTEESIHNCAASCRCTSACTCACTPGEFLDWCTCKEYYDATMECFMKEKNSLQIANVSDRPPRDRFWSTNARVAQLRPLPRRGVSRTEAGIYLGISATRFDELIATGQLPQPKRIGSRKIWDVHKLNVAFEELPVVVISWDGV